ncbi:CsgG/HfaB family protein [Govanella unica]|uniref:CsgG/HfaB family protein n=1 Tax=Govanella unica TaxID=2975056 RepID=A0A9X3TX46_9PROT|nr:CsgG/HfaB family protein [Govania unica]MDA5193300.1 CsgG/HfaB family protein [Govania unica]
MKRKIAIGRFSNETRYGKTLLVDQNLDPLGKQASDILAARLVESGKFLVFERGEADRVKQEQQLSGGAGSLIGVDTLIIGSVTEFGRSTGGEKGWLHKTKVQLAHAKVDVRLVDVRTGQMFFSASGSGEATTESGETLGFGSRADYDATLNDKAIGAAIANLMNSVLTKLQERQWRTDILKVAGNVVYISGGARQGLRSNDELVVYRAGEVIKSQQTGFDIALPAAEVARLRIQSFFGDSEANEGAVAMLESGSLDASRLQGLYVAAGRP